MGKRTVKRGENIKMTIEILKTAEVKEGYIYLEQEDNPLLRENKYCTHFGKSPTNRSWGHYCMSYEDAYLDYIARITRGY